MELTTNQSLAVSPQEIAAKVTSAGEIVTTAKRVVSVDIFRGLNVLLMIFVNNVAEVRGLPWWTYHRGNVNGMTYVDMVFPGFLFLMGMSIPLSLGVRLEKGTSRWRVIAHVAWRSLSLLVLGLFIANAPHVAAQYTHISQQWWTVLGFVGIAMAWIRIPGEEKRRTLHRIIRFAGLAMIAVLFLVFRRVTPEGEPARLDLSYVEILGLLGWAYLLVGTLYVLFAKRFEILAGLFAVMVAFNAFSILGWLDGIHSLFWNPFEAGLSSMTMAGVLASFVIVGNNLAPTFGGKTRWILGAAALLFLAGYVLQPLGISKNLDTPTWCLYCTASNLLMALLLYWIADVKGWKAWANFAKPVGENPLLAYFLPFIPFLLPSLYRLTTFGTSGTWGVVKSAMLTGLMLVVTRVLVRCGVRLRV